MMRRVFYSIYFTHGFFALTCQILWHRELLLIFGGSTFSTLVILVAYMAGLALGNLTAGRWLAPARSAGILLAITMAALAAYIFFIPAIFSLLKMAAALLFPWSLRAPTLFLGAKVLLVFLVLLLPASLIGAAFPLLVSQMERLGEFRNVYVGKLNFLNSLGGVAGALVAGFWFIPAFGTGVSRMIAGLGFLLLAVVLFYFARKKAAPGILAAMPPFAPGGAEHEIRPPAASLRRLLAILFFVSGFTSLSYELLYNRLLIHFTGNSTFSFTLISSSFVLGYALGSLVFYFFFKKTRSLRIFVHIFVALEFAVGLYHQLLPALLPGFYSSADRWRQALDAAGWSRLAAILFTRSLSSFVLVFIPSLCFGMLFPLVFALYFGSLSERPDDRAMGRMAGRLNAANTFGSVLGPALTGLVLIALFRVSPTLRILSVLSMALALSLFYFWQFHQPGSRSRNLRPAILITLLAVLLSSVLPVTDGLGLLRARQSPEDAILFYREGVHGTVSVAIDRRNVRVLKINGMDEVPTDHDSLRAFRMLAYLPFMAHPQARSVLTIAFGGGITLGSVANTAVARVHCVEICPDVLAAAPLFHRENNGVFRNPRVRIFLQDGRSFVQNSRELYDIIISDSTHPAAYDSWVLYTREFYQQALERLHGDGLMAQWIPLHGLSLTDYRIILRTFARIFPHCSLFFTGSYSIVLGSRQPISLGQKHFHYWTGSKKQIAAELAGVGIRKVSDLEDCLVFHDGGFRRFAAGAAISTDSHCPVQFAALRSDQSVNSFSDLLAALADSITQRSASARLLAQIGARRLISLEHTQEALAYLRGLVPGERSAETDFMQHEILQEMAFLDVSSRFGKMANAEAIALLEFYVKSFPDQGYFRAVLGYLHFRNNERAQARELGAASLRLSPWDAAIQKIVLAMACELKDADLARQSISNLRRIDPGNSEYSRLESRVRELFTREKQLP
jgi:spermidine synthase